MHNVITSLMYISISLQHNTDAQTLVDLAKPFDLQLAPTIGLNLNNRESVSRLSRTSFKRFARLLANAAPTWIKRNRKFYVA